MTISFSGYNPMCLDPRHYLFCVPICAISAGRIIYHYTQDWNSRNQWLLTILAIVLLVPTIKFAQYCKSLDYANNKEDLQTLVAFSKTQPTPIVSNQVMVNLLRFYSAYELNERFICNRDQEELPSSNNYLVANSWYTSFHANTSVETICDSLRIDKESLVKVEDFNLELKHTELFHPPQ